MQAIIYVHVLSCIFMVWPVKYDAKYCNGHVERSSHTTSVGSSHGKKERNGSSFHYFAFIFIPLLTNSLTFLHLIISFPFVLKSESPKQGMQEIQCTWQMS